jgi:xylan 1,4-beta-xylosidase
MKYVNPVVRGFYPDPSVCEANGKFYLVNSTFQYFPGMPVFESEDLIHWKQINHCLTRKSQLDLTGVYASGGIFAPTIRYNKGRFYVVVTDTTGRGNFYVYTDDIYGEWSEPIKVERDGIDPSLLFDGDKTYFISNGEDDFGEGGISCCEIDIASGKKLSKAKCISKGCGGRYLEGPHLYKINNYYYLMCAEGGTEYGHMECLLRSKEVFGPYEKCPGNPILTNRNLGGYAVQGSGHADIVQAKDGQWWMVHLAFRQIGRWPQFHNLGRETFLEPIYWTDDGWFTVGADGTSRSAFEVADGKCTILPEPEYPEFKWQLDTSRACYMRLPAYQNYTFGPDEKSVADMAVVAEKNSRNQNVRDTKATVVSECTLTGTSAKLTSKDNVTFIGMRQEEFNGTMEVTVNSKTLLAGQKAGITAYMDENDHYDVRVTKTESGCIIGGHFVVGGKDYCDKGVVCSKELVTLKIEAHNEFYALFAKDDSGKFIALGEGHSKYLASEVTEGFTGTVLALFVEANKSGDSGKVKFSW